ncbi:MAG: hypothetical protein IJ724_11770 [Muribaculaceae bacterium]|nr:hypothetical protein [Muribaculaceae bacterium]
MKKFYLTFCAMLFSMATTVLWGQVSLTSNFYGQGYYRIINLNTARMIEVVGDVVPSGSEIMKSVNMKSFNPAQMHDITSSAGSVIAIRPTKSTSEFDGTWDMNGQGVGTYYLTANNDLVQQLIGMVAGGNVPPNSGVGVRIAESMDFGQGYSVAGNTLYGKAYTAHIDLWDIAPYMSFHGTRRAYFCDNGGNGTGGYTDLKNFALYANLSGTPSATLPMKTNWLIVPMESSFNYYTPTYSNADGTAYVHADGRNWATVYVDFPFMLPDGAVAYTMDENQLLTPIDMTQYDYIPSRAKVMLSWPATSATDELHIVPGYLTASQLAQCEAQRQQRYNEIAVSEVPEDKAMTIKDMLVGALGSEQAFYRFIFDDDNYSGTPTDAEVLNAIRMKFSKLDDINLDMQQLIQNVINNGNDSEYQGYLGWYDESDSDRAWKAAVIKLYVQFFGENVTESQKDNAEMFMYRIMLEINDSYLQARYDQAYNETYGQAYEAAIAKEEAYREQLNRNSGLYWCGDFFAFSEGYSTQEGNAPATADANSLTTVTNDEASFEETIPVWQGNSLYVNKQWHTLQWIVNDGTPGQTYTVSDNLHVVYAYWLDDNEPVHIFAKDDNNYRESSRSVNAEGIIDYMQVDYFNTSGRTIRGHETFSDQSNWVEILVPINTLIAASNDLAADAQNYYDDTETMPEKIMDKHYVLSAVKGVLQDRNNPVLEMSVAPGVNVNNDDEVKVNTFVAANFYEDEVQKGCFFIKPKSQEVAFLAWSVWNGEAFVMPARANDGSVNARGLDGGVKVNLKLTEGDANFANGTAYEFYGVVRKKVNSSTNSKKAGFAYDSDEPISQEFEFWPFYIPDVDVIVTAVDTIGTSKQVAGVEYVNLAGVRSAKPWSGVNIVVTRYNDGTTSSAKAIF